MIFEKFIPLISLLLLCAFLTVSCTSKTIVTTDPNYNYTCNYFVDSQVGNDNYDGRSVTTPWRTYDKATQYSRDIGYQAGDAICFHRGQKFIAVNGYLGRGSSGKSGYQFVYYGAYGDISLPKPIITPSLKIDTLSDWQNDAGFLSTNGGVPTDWQDLGGGVWLWPNSHPSWQASGFWEDNAILKAASSSALTDGDWFFEPGSGLYYRPTDGAAPSTHQLYFAKKYGAMSIHQSSNLVISDLSFEYMGASITGDVFAPGSSAAPVPIIMHDIAIINSDFHFTSTAIELRSEIVDGVSYENHDLLISNNTMSNLRYAIRMHNSNGKEGFYHVVISNNIISDIALNGNYVGTTSTDIEAISLQNASDSIVTGNDIRNGLKEVDGYSNAGGPILFSTAIINWRNPAASINNFEVSNNFISNVSKGIVVGSGNDNKLSNVVVDNNIVENSEIGIKLNGRDAGGGYKLLYNTLYHNNVNIVLAPVTGQTVYGNLSLSPVSYHIDAIGAGSDSIVDHNGYSPDGAFYITDTSDASNNITIPSVSEWQAYFSFSPDLNSVVSASPLLISINPVEPGDFRLSATSPFVDQLSNSISGVYTDFIGNPRPVGVAGDMGAWER